MGLTARTSGCFPGIAAVKTIVTVVLTASLLAGSVMAQPNDRGADRGSADNRDGPTRGKKDDAPARDKAGPHAKGGQPAKAAEPAQPPRQAERNTQSGRPDRPDRPPQPAPRAPSNEQPRPQSRAPQYSAPARGYWTKGERLPSQAQTSQYVVGNYGQWGLRTPPNGQRWVRDDRNNFYLVMINSGLVADVYSRSDRDRRWQQSYSRPYSYNDDVYYQQCRSSSDPAGVLVGTLIGGLLGHAVGSSGNRTASTTAGVILGGALGAAMTRNLDCNDRSYAYRTYYTGLNSGRTGARYDWRNPNNDHRGNFTVGRYYNDRNSFRCADFSQIIYIGGRQQTARGTACRQPDGSWVAVR